MRPSRGAHAADECLVHDGLVMDDFATVHGYPQISGVIDTHLLCIAVLHTDIGGISARCDDEVVLDLPCLSVVRDVDAPDTHPRSRRARGAEHSCATAPDRCQ